MKRFRTFPLALLPCVLALQILGCAGMGGNKKDAEETAPADSLDARMLQGHRYEASSLCKTLEQQRWDYWVHGRDYDEFEVLEEHAGLLSPGAMKLVDRVASRLPADNTRGHRQLTHFKRFILKKIANANVAEMNRDIEALQDAAIVQIGDSTAPFSQIAGVLASEESAARRRAIAAASTRTIRILHPHYEAKEADARRMAAGLGFSSYVALSSELRNTDIIAMATACEQFLTATDEVYTRTFAEMTRKLTGIPATDFARCDIAQLFIQPQFDLFFPADDLLSVCHTTLLGMGIDINRQDNLTLDMEDRPEKIPQPSAFPIEVPSDVRLSVVPSEGRRYYESLLHELGRAEFYACSMSQVWEFTVLEGEALTDGYGLLFSSLTGDPQWLDTYTGMDEKVRADYVRYAAFTRLFLMRRLCGKVLYELDIRNGSASVDARKAYRERLSRAYGIPLTEEDAERYLMDADDFFEEVDAIRASWFAATLARHFRAKYGNRWFESTDASLELRSLWGAGTESTLEEIVTKLGAGSFGPGALIAEITRNLSGAEETGS